MEGTQDRILVYDIFSMTAVEKEDPSIRHCCPQSRFKIATLWCLGGEIRTDLNPVLS